MSRERVSELFHEDQGIIEALSRPADMAWPDLEVWRSLDYNRLSAILGALIAAARCVEMDILPDYRTARSPLVNERYRPAKGASFFQCDPETGEEFVWITSGLGTCLASRRIAIAGKDGKEELEANYYRHPQAPGEPLARSIKASSIRVGEDYESRKEIEIVNKRLFESPDSLFDNTESHKLEMDMRTDDGRVFGRYEALRNGDAGQLFGRSLILRRYRRGDAERPISEISIRDTRDSIRDLEEGTLKLEIIQQQHSSTSDEAEEFLSQTLKRVLRSKEAALELGEGAW